MSTLELDQDNNNVKIKSRNSTISGLDYGVVAPTPPPLPGQQLVTHFPASNSEMVEKRRVSIINGQSSVGKHSLSSNINIITAPDKHILPGVYK